MMNSLMNSEEMLHIIKMDSTGWDNEEDIFAQQCGVKIPSGE